MCVSVVVLIHITLIWNIFLQNHVLILTFMSSTDLCVVRFNRIWIYFLSFASPVTLLLINTNERSLISGKEGVTSVKESQSSKVSLLVLRGYVGWMDR